MHKVVKRKHFYNSFNQYDKMSYFHQILQTYCGKRGCGCPPFLEFLIHQRTKGMGGQELVAETICMEVPSKISVQLPAYYSVFSKDFPPSVTLKLGKLEQNIYQSSENWSIIKGLLSEIKELYPALKSLAGSFGINEELVTFLYHSQQRGVVSSQRIGCETHERICVKSKIPPAGKGGKYGSNLSLTKLGMHLRTSEGKSNLERACTCSGHSAKCGEYPFTTMPINARGGGLKPGLGISIQNLDPRLVINAAEQIRKLYIRQPRQQQE